MRSPEAAALAKGMPARDMKFDHVFGGLSAENHRTTTSVHDPKSGHTVVQTFDDQFPICVVCRIRPIAKRFAWSPIPRCPTPSRWQRKG